MSSGSRSPAGPWWMLAASVTAQAAASVAINGPAYLIPAFQDRFGFSLAQAGTLAAMPVTGVMISLLLWGYAVDRVGERRSLLVGLAGTTVLGAVACLTGSPVALGAALLGVGLAAASTGSASGRVVVGWFPAERRGLAMGIRQMAQPLGVAVAAVSMAAVADLHGLRLALVVPVAVPALAVVVVAVVVRDPPRPERTPALTANPYRASPFLARIHGVSVLLVVPQFLTWTFALTWLVQERGWSPAAAGALVAATQVVGAVGRILVGALSDRVGSRVRPLRWVALSAAVVMLLLGLTEPLPVGVLALVLASSVTSADNGLAFTSVAERAGAFWSGRALGLQNTVQYLTAAAVAPLGGLAITGAGYAVTFGASAVLPLLAAGLVPRRDEVSETT